MSSPSVTKHQPCVAPPSLMKYMMPVNGQWRVWHTRDLIQLRENGQGAQADALTAEYSRYEANRIANFLPHGQGSDFINDRTNGIAFLTAGNQNGKTFHGAAFSILRIVPCDPSWKTFTENGIDYHDWDGPKIWICASYSWDNVEVMWTRYRDLLPRHELGPYAPGFPREDLGETGRPRVMAFGSGRPQKTPLTCGTQIIWLCYTQSQVHWESREADGAHFDEQPPREKYNGFVARTTTRGDEVQCCFTLTGHVLKDRPDTGAGGFCHKLVKGEEPSGWTLGQYKIGVADVPDCIITPARKEQLRKEWVTDPAEKGDIKKMREGEARFNGGWESTSGLVFGDEWERSIHVIPALWADNETPPEFTKYRVIDYGESAPTTCAWFALIPARNKWSDDSFAVMYRLYYEPGKLIAESAREIIEASHNTRDKQGEVFDEATETTLTFYQENPCGEEYFSTILDSRSLSQRRGTDYTTGDIFMRYGLAAVAAPGGQNKDLQGFLKDWLRIDYDKKHIISGEWGAPRLYVIDICDDFVREIEGLRKDPRNPEKWDKRDPDHAVDPAKYFAAVEPTAIDFSRNDDDDDNTQAPEGLPYTGYIPG